MNRRGYNTYVACESCGNVVTCPNCSISLTYHNANRRLMCHYCGYSVPFSRVCPECGEEAVRYSGSGTQKVEEELAELLPGARILRMDADTTMQKYAYDRNLSAFRDGEYDIMVGTQMVAKGLDFENVTLVGVLNADKELYNDDFQSMERTFDLITQVVGRAGRGRWSGKAVIQTMNPGNEVIRFAREQDYESFYSYEIGVRRAMVYPPFCTLVSVGFRGAKQDRVEQAAAAHAGTGRPSGRHLPLPGPHQVPVPGTLPEPPVGAPAGVRPGTGIQKHHHRCRCGERLRRKNDYGNQKCSKERGPHPAQAEPGRHQVR